MQPPGQDLAAPEEPLLQGSGLSACPSFPLRSSKDVLAQPLGSHLQRPLTNGGVKWEDAPTRIPSSSRDLVSGGGGDVEQPVMEGCTLGTAVPSWSLL